MTITNRYGCVVCRFVNTLCANSKAPLITSLAVYATHTMPNGKLFLDEYIAAIDATRKKIELRARPAPESDDMDDMFDV